MTDAERFWEKVDREAGRLDGTGCWVWTASGRFGLSNGRSSITPRRYAWEALQQELGLGSLTQDEILRMACGRSACVNPGHMQKGAKPPRRQGSRTCARGHTMDADNGYWVKDGTWVCRPCKHDHSRRYRQDPAVPGRPGCCQRQVHRRGPAAGRAQEAAAAAAVPR